MLAGAAHGTQNVFCVFRTGVAAPCYMPVRPHEHEAGFVEINNRVFVYIARARAR